MAAPIGLRGDYDGAALRGLAKRSKDAGQARRLLALSAIYDGGSRGDAAKLGGVGLQTVRDWVLAFNADGPDGLIDRKGGGPSSKLSAEQWAEVARLVEAGPIPAVHGVVRWRLLDLTQWIRETFGVSLSKQTMSDRLRAMGYRKLSARPRHHAQDPQAAETFKKSSPRSWRASRARRQPKPQAG